MSKSQSLQDPFLNALRREKAAQPVEADKVGAVPHLGGVVELDAGVVGGAEAADGIEAFEREAHRVDALMADGAGVILAMLQEHGAHVGGLRRAFGQLRHVGRIAP